MEGREKRGSVRRREEEEGETWRRELKRWDQMSRWRSGLIR